jgi:hypothetical protein
VLQAMERAPTFCFFVVFVWASHLNFSRN